MKDAAKTRADEMKKKQNIVMFPFMAQGHIIPFLALALKIHNHNLDNNNNSNLIFTVVNTPQNIKNLKSNALPPNLPIEFLDLPFNSSDHGLPPDAENTDVLPYPLVIRLISAAASLKPAFSKLISDLTVRNGSSPVCIVSDIFLGWTVDVAKEFGIYHAMFCGGGGFGFGCYYSIWINMPHKKIAAESMESTFTLPDLPEAGEFELSQLPANQLNADGTDPWSTFQASNLPKWIESDAILLNTIAELDKVGLSYFEGCTKKKIWAIGPVVLPSENRTRVGRKHGITLELCIKWLDSKPENSVLYVSFGSNNTISAPNMTKLAVALENSGVNFIWVVRPPLGFDIKSDFRDSEWLPEGFVKRNGGRGLLVPNWAPQVDILSHRSVACFLSHCGWGSVMEALSEGVVLLGWPLAGEQFYNAKFLVEIVGVCMEVARGSGNDQVSSEDVCEKIELVMRGEKGEEMRRKAGEVREMISGAAVRPNGSSAKAMDEFLKVIHVLT